MHYVITFSVPQPSPARNANTRVQRPPEPGKPATPLPNTAKIDRPSTKKERFITKCFYERERQLMITYRIYKCNESYKY